MRRFSELFTRPKLNPLLVLPVASLFIFTPTVAAKGFLASVSPARLELKAKPGKVVRGALAIRNLGREPVNYLVRSSEWDFTETGQSLFTDKLEPESCRPWLRLERRKISIKPQALRNFRYEFHIPDNAPAKECRLAILVEGEDFGGIADAGAGMSLPVKGRVAVIIYLAVGGVKPSLNIASNIDNKNDNQPSLDLINTGTATGRVAGLLRGLDADNNDFDVAVSRQPILPGQQRALALVFNRPGTRKTAKPNYPVTISGDLFWQHGTLPVNRVIEQ